ncbi:MAG: AraC family transcriptional regulator [Lachnospiraceae bacterium]|nr:AraC family transcriptional regulator [Lachnospiraceae bacterium]
MEKNNRPRDEHAMRWEACEARTYIMEHFMEKLTWKDVAEHVNMSENYLRTIYMEVYNQKWKDTLTECRMKYAAELLVKTKSSVTEISKKSCYRHTPYFCHVFKEWSGMTPLEYRRKNAQWSGG